MRVRTIAVTCADPTDVEHASLFRTGTTTAQSGDCLMGRLSLLGSVLRYWRIAAAGSIVLIIAFLWLSLQSEQRHAAKLNAQLADANALIGVQARAARRLADESARRMTEAKTLLAAANKANRLQAPHITALRRSAARPRTVAEPCTISDTLQTMSGL
ncbi:hypothetical protein [Sphingosinicella sp. BN140058]|uniref:hypothetical protein n=1 Tax=Sphingosinicella sp. BN140058 TaxID=1892855 RepID=UPI00101369FC|nr:hypothetical protein [Sphingosinicella sp. BN140058]QAY78768.1 hypothetical protein ETR14_21180 [Sphingosinicella sp. BN140058]